MKSKFNCFVVLFLAMQPLAWVSLESPSFAQDFQSANVERIKADVKHLSSDAMKGRDVFGEEIAKAADYIVKSFKDCGLQVDAVDGGPFQYFEIASGMALGPDKENRLLLKHDDKVTTLELSKDFQVMGMSASAEGSGELVFVGYGITAKDEKYDDYESVDVKDKVVLMLRREPQQDDANSVFNGTENSDYALFSTKINNARRQGAKAVIIVNDSFSLRNANRNSSRSLLRLLERLNKLKTDFEKIETPTLKQLDEFADDVTKLTERIDTAAARVTNVPDALVPFAAARGNTNRDMPVFFAARAAFADVIKKSYDGKTLEELELTIDEKLEPVSKILTGCSIECQAKIVRNVAKVKNVIGVLPGKGELAKEILIVGAHYDHVGMGGFGSLAPWTNEIHNGADDNASGTSGLLEIARLVAATKSDSHRTVVFMAFAGEERGLLGSIHYCNNPVFALEDTVAMVNLDMIGRLTNNRLTVYGTGTSSGFDKLVEDLNKDFKFTLAKIPGGLGASDHESFYKKKIAVFHMFTGLHSDYHRPGDDYDKINYPGMEKITQMTYRIVQNLATTSDKPAYIKVVEKRGQQRETRVWLGVSSDLDRAKDGFVIDTVSSSSPAEDGGLESGDIILKIAGKKVENTQDVRTALSGFRPDDKVKVVVKRGAEEKTFEIKLGER